MKRIEEHSVGIPGLPEGMDGVRVLHVSDLHMTRWSARREERIRTVLADCACDVVALTGDFVNGPRCWNRLGPWLESALPCAPRFAVPGNWDHRMSPSLRELEGALDRARVELVLNRPVRVPVREGSLVVVGMDDVRFGGLDIEAAFAGVTPDDVVIAMAHNPDVLLHLDSDRFDLLLCGHTHGGQVCLPGYGALLTSTRLGKRFESGLYGLSGGASLYVSRGIGTGRVPFRICCPPELALLTLRPILEAEL